MSDTDIQVAEDAKVEATSKKIIEVAESFQFNEGLVKREITEIDELYTSMKDHYDAVKDWKHKPRDMNIGADGENPIPKTFSFIHQQAANIIALKSLKLSLIKELNTMTKVRAELNLKEFAVLIREKMAAADGNEGAIARMALKMIEMIATDDSIKIIRGDFTDAEIEDGSVDDELNARLKEESLGSIKQLTKGETDDTAIVRYSYLDISGDENRYRFVIDENNLDEPLVYDNLNDEYIALADFEYELKGVKIQETDGIYTETDYTKGDGILEVVEFEDVEED